MYWTTLLIFFVVWGILKLIKQNKERNDFMESLKYEILYFYIGFKAVLEDIWKIGRNKADQYEKPDHIIVITGGLRGIGLEVIRMLLECNMTIVVGCRSLKKAEDFALKIREEGTHSGKLDFRELDVSCFDSVRIFAESVKSDYPKINVLINNAAIMYVPYATTSDGFESQIATNYLGPVLLTHLLLEPLIATGTEEDPARIVNITSVAHVVGEINFEDINSTQQYVALKAYSQSKLALLLFSMYLNVLLKEKHFVECFAVHPGIVNTELFSETFVKKITPWLLGALLKPPEKGAIPIVFCAISPRAKGLGGCYISNCERKDTSATVNSENLQEKLFDFTMDLLKIKEFGIV